MTTKHYVVSTMDDNYGEVTLFVSHMASHAQKWFDKAATDTCTCIYHSNFVPTIEEITFTCPDDLTEADGWVTRKVFIDNIEVKGGCDHRLGDMWFKPQSEVKS